MCYSENVLHDLDIKFYITAYIYIYALYIYNMVTLRINLSLFEISGYDLCHIDRKGKTGGGVALHDNNHYDYKVSDNLSFTITDNTEFLTIELKNKQNKNIIRSCIYRQPGSDINILSHTIEELFKAKRSNIQKCEILILLCQTMT